MQKYSTKILSSRKSKLKIFLFQNVPEYCFNYILEYNFLLVKRKLPLKIKCRKQQIIQYKFINVVAFG